METYDLYPDIALELSKLSPEQVDAVRAYLQELGASGAGQEEHRNKYLTFSCCGQIFDVPIRQVRQILRIPEITRLPDSLPYMKGVISLREEMVPVIDLRIRLGKAPEADSGQTCIVIVTVQEHAVGMIVDSVSNVESLSPEEICPPPRQEEHKANYLTGIAKRETVILLVNPDNLFTAHDFNSILDLSARQS